MGEHAGHRARRKALFLEHGLDVFADHEALELLLYYALPRVDTNPIAHRLITAFGNLDGVLRAKPEDLARVEGVGDHAATLLSLILPLARRARMCAAKSPVILSDTERQGAYFLELLENEREERFCQACLDAKGKLLLCATIGQGAPGSVVLNVRTITENAFRSGASAVVLAHNHPSGLALPSRDDIQATRMVQEALQSVGVRLVDHIIVADGDFVSLRQNNSLD